MGVRNTDKSISNSPDNSEEWYTRLKSIIENALTPTLLFDKNGKIIFYSLSFEDLWRRDGKDVLKSYNILEDTLKEAGIMPLIQEALKGIIPENMEIDYVPGLKANTGRPRRIRANANPVMDGNGIIAGAVVVMEDITDIMTNEGKANYDNEILHNFMNSVSDALVIYDDHLNYVELNRVAEEQIGRPKSEVIGRNIREIIPGIENSRRYEQYLKIVKTGETYEEEVDNHPFFPGKIVLIKAFKLSVGMGITSTDITQSKRELQRELNLNKELEILKNSALDLIEFNIEDDLYHYTAKKLNSLCESSFVIINMVDPESNRVVVKGLGIDSKDIKTINRLLGNPILGRSFPYYHNQKKLKSGKLFRLENGLYEIAGGEVSKSICRAIEVAFNIKQIYTIGLIRQGHLYGNALILTNNKDVDLNTHLIDALINQISIAIHRIATEKALLDSEKRFEIAFSTSPDSVNINRLRDGVYVEINEGFTEITGYNREDIIGFSSLEKDIWVNKEDRQKLVSALDEYGFVRNMEAEFCMKNGEVRVGLMSAQRFVKDGIDHIISITRDITHRIDAERSLRASEERYRVVAKQTGQIIYDYNILSGKINWAGAIEEVTGYSPGEFSNVDISVWETLVHPDDFGKITKLLANAIEFSGSFDAEYRLRKKDETYINIEEHGVCIKSETGTLRMLGSMADITERIKYQNNLRIAWKKAEESDKLKTAFLTNLSHEIRTPMNAILGFSGLLMNSKTSEAIKTEYISMINRSSHNLLNIINEIIDFSMIETGQLQIYNSECDINDIIKELYETFRQYKIIEGKDHLQIDLHHPEEVPMNRIISDEKRIKQVISNLLSNAIKYTPKGGISFGYSLRDVNSTRPLIEFSIIDSGIGIDQKDHETIFERFRQLDDSNTRKYGGNGLGLSISKQIANLMGGDISLTSEPGRGSKFYFTIPYLPAKKECIMGQEVLPKQTFVWNNKRIILAEDVVSNYRLVESMLQDTGIKIDWAKDGKEVLSLIEREKEYNLILMDIRMPGMNGYQATMEIRKTNTDLPIIALSANAMQSDREKSISIGCNGHISKPISLDSLLEVMAEYLS